MARMKTFLIYFLCLVGFIFLSYILENALIGNMYIEMSGTVDSSQNGIEIKDASGRATNVNGYMNFTITDNSNDGRTKYIKIDLFNKKGRLVATKYVELKDLDENNQKKYSLKIRGNEIRSFKVSVLNENEIPDLSNIISVFGYDIDLSNIFGLDLSNISIFGRKVKDMFDRANVKENTTNIWARIQVFLASIPWWGYAIGAGIVVWYLPARYLFGIFP